MTTTKTSKQAASAAAAETTKAVETLGTQFIGTVDNLADLQKNGVDAAVKQSDEVLGAWKKLAQTIPGAPGIYLLEMAFNGFSQFANMQKAAIDIAVEQSRKAVGRLNERANSSIEAFEGVAAMVQQTVDDTVAAQKKTLDYSSAQAKAVLASTKLPFGLTTDPSVSEAFQRGMDNLIASQKELLDIAVRPFNSVN